VAQDILNPKLQVICVYHASADPLNNISSMTCVECK